MADSSIPKFFEKSLKERLGVVADFSGLSQDELKIIEDATGGIVFYYGDKIKLDNPLVLATLRTSHLFNLEIDEDEVKSQTSILSGLGRIRDVAVGPDGYLYLITSNTDGKGFPDASDDKLLRIVK